MKVYGWSKTDVGNVRENNEDSYLVDAENRLFIVADGVGGSPAGEVASQQFIKSLSEAAPNLAETLKEKDPALDRNHREKVFADLLKVIQETNSEIFRIGKEINPTSPSATTCDVMLVADSVAFIAHVGDSRVYLLRGGNIFRVTEDHTFAEQLRAEEIDDPDMVERFRNVLTRSIGGRPHVDIDALFIHLQPDDRVLMCSDGLTDYLSGQQILEFALRYNGDELLEHLVQEAKDCGGADNITAVLVEVEGDSLDTRATSTFDTMRQVDILGQISLFEDLDLRELIRVLRVVYEVPHSDGDIIVEPGNEADCLYIVAEGGVQLTQGGLERSLTEGEHFGGISLVLDAPRRQKAVAVGDTLLLVVPADRFRELVFEDPILGNKLLWNLLYSAAEQIVRLEEQSD